MINFRFHIVSLTAVLLALGIGLMLGTTFLDQATVDALQDQQERLENDIGAANERNTELARLIDTYEEEDADLDEQVGERLFDGVLADVPVLVVTTRGVDEDQVDRVTQALSDADARLLGTWWLGDRLRLDDGDEVADLADALQLSTDDAVRLRSTLAGQLGDVLSAAGDASGASGGNGDTQGLVGAPAQGAGEAPVVARLVEGGFLEYEMPEGADGDVVTLPSSGLRVVVVSGPEASVPPGEVVVPTLVEYSVGGPVPAVAIEPSVVPAGEDPPEDPPESLVIDVRGDADLSDRVSTVDDLDRVSGLLATVLAVQDADPTGPLVGHYGLGDGARLLPEPPGTGE